MNKAKLMEQAKKTQNKISFSSQQSGEHDISRRTLLASSIAFLGLQGCGAGSVPTQIPVAVSNSGVVTTFAGTAGDFGIGVDGTGAAAKFMFIRGMTVDLNDTLYVVDNLTIRKITSAGVVTTFLGGGPAGTSSGNTDATGTDAWFNEPRGIAVDVSGNLYIADSASHAIRKSTPAGVVTTFAGSLSATAGDADGTGNAALFDSPSGVAVDASGNVYVADTGNHRIRKITPAGVVTTLAGSSLGVIDGTGTSAKFDSPYSVAVGIDGNVYVSDTENHIIRKIVAATGVVTTFAGPSFGNPGFTDGNDIAARFFRPRGLAFDTSGNLYVADSENHAIRKITPQGVVTTIAGCSPLTGRQSGSTDGTGTSARFNTPYGLAVDLNNRIYVGDTGNFAVRKIS